MLKTHMEAIIRKSETNVQNVVQTTFEDTINTQCSEMTNRSYAQRQAYEDKLKTLHSQVDALHQEHSVQHTQPSLNRHYSLFEDWTAGSNSASSRTSPRHHSPWRILLGINRHQVGPDPRWLIPGFIRAQPFPSRLNQETMDQDDTIKKHHLRRYMWIPWN